MFLKTVYFQNADANKQYTVKIVPAGQKARVIGLFGKIGGGQQEFVATPKPVAKDKAKAAALALIDRKIKDGYSFELKPIKKITAKVIANRLKAALEVKPAPAAKKAVDARAPKTPVNARAPKGNAVIQSLAGLLDASGMKIGQIVTAAIETCDRCKGKDDECEYCEGAGQQALITIGAPSDGPMIVRPSNLKFMKKAA